MGDEQAELPGMADGQVEADGGAQTLAQHDDGLVGEVREQPVHVVGVPLDGDGAVFAGVDRAAAQAAPVVRDHGVVGGEQGHQVDAAVRVALAALGDQQERPRAAQFVVEAGARHAQEVCAHARHSNSSFLMHQI